MEGLVGPVLRSGGGEIPTSSLKDIAVVALYFSAHWCPPCRQFTPRLKDVYRRAKEQGKSFEVIFVSGDRDENSFREYFGSMPWLAVPFADRFRQQTLNMVFQVRGIPNVVLLKGSGELISNSGRDTVISPMFFSSLPQSGNAQAPAATPAATFAGAPGGASMEGLLGPVLRKGAEEVATSEVLRNTAVVALYFSAHWCPPCRQFTPEFGKVYKRCKEQGKSFEVVFVSGDRDEASYREYFSTMPWLSLPFSDRTRQQAIGETFSVRGLPGVVLLKGNGELIDGNARSRVMSPTFMSTLPRQAEEEDATPPLPDDEPCMVRVRHKGTEYDLECEPGEGWDILRMQIFSLTEVPVEQQRLFGLGSDVGLISEDAPLAKALARGKRVAREEKAVAALTCANVPQSARKGSTIHEDRADHNLGCLDSERAWCTKGSQCEEVKRSNYTAWYQMDLGEPRNAAGVIIQPRADSGQYVKSFKVSVADAEDGPWTSVSDGHVFKGVSCCVEPQRRCAFPDGPVLTRFVRIIPVTFKGHLSLRADVLLAPPEEQAAGDSEPLPTIVVVGNFSSADPFEVAGTGASSMDRMVEEQHLALLQAKMSSMPPRLQGQVNSLKHVQKYEERPLQLQALDLVPGLWMDASIAACSSRQAGYELDFMKQLLRWFKHDFFTWTNTPRCESCGSTRTKGMGTTQPTQVEQAYGANTVEVASCQDCGNMTRFPRYNDPGKLLETRTGRCGEWANCFTLVCRSLGFEARHVHDWTDHVWTEIFSDSLGRWVHADSCEAALDCPLIYEQGWGKKLTYCIAFARDHVCDVSRRYTKKFDEMLARRTLFPEQQLAQTISSLCDFAIERALASLPEPMREPRRRALTDRSTSEGAALASSVASDAVLKPGEQVGRTSGDKEWRDQRGELGATASARAQAIEKSDTGVASDTTVDVKGSWIQSARNYSMKDGLLSAELRRCNGSWARSSIQVEEGASYSNQDGMFQLEARAATPPAAPAAAAASAAAPAAAPATALAAAPAAAPASPSSTPSKEAVQALIKAKFEELVASGVDRTEAAAKALTAVREQLAKPAAG